MKNPNKLVTMILAVLMLVGSTVAYADTSASETVSQNISIPAMEEQPEAEATPATEAGDEKAPAKETVNEQPEAEATPATEAVEETDPAEEAVEEQPEAEATPATEAIEETAPAEEAVEEQPESETTPAPEAVEETAPAEEVVEEPAGEVPETEAIVTTESESGTVDIRAAASADAEIIGQLSGNDHVVVLGVEGDWVKVRVDGIEGYVFSAYLDIAPQPQPEEQTEVAPAVQQKISITANRDVSQLFPGDVLVLNAQLSGFEGIDYSLNWQAKYPGGSWENIDGATGAMLTINITETHNGCSWRLQVSGNV